MKIIVCGAGLVGQGIARQLAQEGHGVTIIDQSHDLLRELGDRLDVRTLTGHGVHPVTLQKAGADEADVLIAVTSEDEVNMLICQMAHSLFKVPSKIARIRNPAYAPENWENLFTEAHIPVNVPIHPEVETANAIMRRLSLPGAAENFDLIGGKVRLAAIAIGEECPVVDTPLHQLHDLFPDLRAVFCAIVRDGKLALVEGGEQLSPGDLLYVTVDERDIERALGIFGHQEKAGRRILIAGASNTGLELARALRARSRHFSFSIVEPSRARAAEIAEQLKRVLILNGNPTDPALLREAGVAECDNFIALTDDDEMNILSTVMAKNEGASNVMCIYNQRIYGAIMSRLGIDAYISPRAITIATILRHIRRGKVAALHTVFDGAAEVIEAEVIAGSHLAGKTPGKIEMPEGVLLAAIWREGEFITPTPESEIKPDDHVIMFVLAEQVKQAELLIQAEAAHF